MNSQKRRLDEYWHSSQAHTVLNFTRKTLPLTALPTVLFHFCRHWRVRHPEKNPAFPLLSLRKKRGKAPIVVDDPGIFRMGPINHPKKVGCAPTRRTAPCFHGSPKKVYLAQSALSFTRAARARSEGVPAAREVPAGRLPRQRAAALGLACARLRISTGPAVTATGPAPRLQSAG